MREIPDETIEGSESPVSNGLTFSISIIRRAPHPTLTALGCLVVIVTMQVLSTLSSSHNSSSLFSHQRNLQEPQNYMSHRGIAAHYVTLMVGGKNTAKKLRLELDSEATTFPCSDCDENSCAGIPNLFDPSSSHILACPKDRCVFQEAKCEDSLCVVRMEEPETQQTYLGYEVQDQAGLFTAGSQQHSSPTFPLTFQCMKSMSPGISHSVSDGILGMSPAPLSFVRQMHSSQKLPASLFSLCFRELPVIVGVGTSAGSVALGSVDRTQHVTPLVWARNTYNPTIDTYIYPTFASTPYSVHVRRVYLSIGKHQDDLLTRISQGSIGLMPIDANVQAVDDMVSDTTNMDPFEFLNGSKGSVGVQNRHVETLLHRSAEPAFRAAFATVTGMSFPSSGGVGMSELQFNHLPTILLQLEANKPNQSVPIAIPGFIGRHGPAHPYDVLLAIPPRHYLHYESGIAVPTLTFHDTLSRLGTHALQGHDVVFDLDNGRIGLAERAACSEGISLAPPASESEASPSVAKESQQEASPITAEQSHGGGSSTNSDVSNVRDNPSQQEMVVVHKEEEEVVVQEEWVPEDVVTEQQAQHTKETRTGGSGQEQNEEPVVVPGEGGRPGETVTQVDDTMTVTSDSTEPQSQPNESPSGTTVTASTGGNAASDTSSGGNGLPSELDESGASNQGSATRQPNKEPVPNGGKEADDTKPPAESDGPVPYEGEDMKGEEPVKEYEGGDMNGENENDAATATTEQQESTPESEQGGEEKEEQHPGLPQANQGDTPPAFRVGPGAVRSKQALGGVTNTVGGNGFWNLVGFAAFFVGFFVTAVATRDDKSNSREKNYKATKRIGKGDGSLGKGGKGGDMTVATGYTSKGTSKGSLSKLRSKAKSVWPFEKSSKPGKKGLSTSQHTSKSSTSFYPSKGAKSPAAGKKLAEDKTVFTKDDPTVFTSGHTSFFHSNSGHTSPADRNSLAYSDSWFGQDHEQRSFYSGDCQSFYSGEDQSYYTTGSQGYSTPMSTSGYMSPASYSRHGPGLVKPSFHSGTTGTWDMPTFHNANTEHTVHSTPTVSSESDSFYDLSADNGRSFHYG